MNLKSSGKLVYAPKTHLRDSEKWLVLMCDEELSLYYKCLFKREFPHLPKLQRPVWGAHVSVIRGEKIPNADLWGFAANQVVNFEYEPGVSSNGEYYWLKVHCDELAAIRELYGMSRAPRFGFHLTIGRTTADV